MTRLLGVGCTVLLALAAVLAGIALWLAFDNPDIGPTSRGSSYTCLAPWDTALNDASNYPGGEPPPDGDEIAARCRAAGEQRWDWALRAGLGVPVLVIGASVAGILAYRRDRRPTRAPDHDS